MTDRKLKRIARDVRDGILNGRSSELMCAAVCLPLQTFLHCCYDIKASIEEAQFSEVNHIWLRLPDGRILDPTADQFGLEPVYLGPLPRLYSLRKARLQVAG
jgi:hypothetical protein